MNERVHLFFHAISYVRSKIDMTPPNKLAETVKQVTKILRSPGCRYISFVSNVFAMLTMIRKTPVFVKSMETAVELSDTFGKERYVGTLFRDNCIADTLKGYVQYSS